MSYQRANLMTNVYCSKRIATFDWNDMEV